MKLRAMALLSLYCAATVAAGAPPATTTVENFETATVPAEWNVTAGSDLVATPERFKSGENSLRWSWSKPGAVLTGAMPVGLPPRVENKSLALWLYNEKAVERILRLELLRGGEVMGQCWYVLNFKGWRPLGALYDEVLKEPKQAPDSFRLIAPADAGEGRLYIDLVNFRCVDKLHADHQQPWVGRPEILKTATPEKFIYSSHDISQNRPWLPKLVPESRISAEERKSMEIILARCVDGEDAFDVRCIIPKGYPAKKDPDVLKEFETLYRIRRSPDGILTGRPIVPPPQLRSFNAPPDGAVLHLIDPRQQPQYPEAMMLNRLMEAYRFEKTKGSADRAAKLKSAFFDLCDHLIDQGFAEGNSNDSSWCFAHRMIFAMREELAETRRLRDMLLAGIACGTSYGDGILTVEDWRTHDIVGGPRNTDGFRNYPELLAMVALLPDPAERRQRLYAYSRAVSLLCDPQLGEPYAWDGTCHHHPLFHLAYAFGALTPVAFHLRDTCFQMTPEAIAVLKRSVMAVGFMANSKGIVPPNCPGYTGQPLGIYSRDNLAALMMAYCNTADCKNGVDPDLAGICLAFHTDSTNAPAPIQKFRDLGIAPYKPTGHLTMNGTAIAVHRRDNWLVSIAGQYKFRRPHEPNGTYCASSYNHYSRNGSVFVVSRGAPPSPFDSGFSLEGWDSRQVPGTTSYLGQNPKHWYRSTVRPGGPLNDPTAFLGLVGQARSAFGGGTDLDGDGIWGLEYIHDDDKFADNLRFHKSAFCFGNRITLLTTGIGRGTNAQPAECVLPIATTLWQNAFGSGGRLFHPSGKERHVAFGWNVPVKPAPTPPEQEPCWVNGEPVKDFPWTTTLPTGPARWLIDNKRTGYFIHPNSPPLHLARRTQTWAFVGPGFEPSETTTGQFAVAWFEHGAKPDTTECGYTLIPETTPVAMAQFAQTMSEADPPYRIFQKDAQAHILRDRDSKTTGYLVFDLSWASQSTILQAVNRPCSVMVKEAEGSLRLSVASTDMDSWGREILVSGDIVLTLAGQWKITAGRPDCTVKLRQNTTLLRIPFKDFMPVCLNLKPNANGEPK